MRLVLFGKNGQVGWELQQLFPKLWDVTSWGHSDLDVSNTKAVEKILAELKPDLIVNASAYTEVDQAEKEPELAMKVNAHAPAAMAEAARKTRAVFIHYSTDYVFDGAKEALYTENDAPNPLSKYGLSKLAGEDLIKQVGGAYLILRTSWVYSMRGNTFVNKVLTWARKNTALKIVGDQISNPTWARALAETTSQVFEQYQDDLFNGIKSKSGIYHLAGSGYTSRYEWAKEILANAPDRTELLTHTIEPVSSDTFPLPAARPLFSALDCSKFKKTFGLSLPNWKESLQTAMSE